MKTDIEKRLSVWRGQCNYQTERGGDRTSQRHEVEVLHEIIGVILVRFGMSNTEIIMFKNAESTSVLTLKNRFKNKLDVRNEVYVPVFKRSVEGSLRIVDG
ncbi:MAG: hypothetical protein HRT58_14535 [Crocinitomicaceae bacterium]|nr:hypothetical protein [Flavobacteriales bacterium]NQZ36884.1 hypothetical protein [Crocinitomicaceae bacterium]